jgi:hypothetical protein
MKRLLPLILILICAFPVAAQTNRAALTGIVMDPSRAVIPGAKVTLEMSTTGIDYVAITNSAGVYTFSGLLVGRYTASITAKGFETLQIQSFALEVGETRTLNATLQLGTVNSTVTVVDAASDLDQTSAEIGGVIHGKQTDALPVNGRYWASLMTLIPGALSSGTGTQDTIRFAGLSQEDNNFRFDGVDATGLNHQFVKEPARLQFPMESIAEFKGSSAVYSADVGGSAGGQISMVSKTGTNNYHGSVYEYFRNDAFDAKQFNAASVSPLRLNNFGVSFSGPIISDKLFFLANYEAVRQMFYQQLRGNVPTDAYRAQVAQTSPALAPLVNAYPQGSTPTADPNALLWVSTGRNPTNEDAGLFRIDYALSNKTAVSVRFNTNEYRTTQQPRWPPKMLHLWPGQNAPLNCAAPAIKKRCKRRQNVQAPICFVHKWEREDERFEAVAEDHDQDTAEQGNKSPRDSRQDRNQQKNHSSLRPDV